MKNKIAINGFGRIGRGAFKSIIEDHSGNLEVVAINDLSDPESLVHLLKYDSVYGVYKNEVLYKKEDGEDFLVVKTKEEDFKIRLYAQKDPEGLPWGDLNVDVVLECTGIFRDYEGSRKHITAGAKKVVISAPSKDPEKIPSFVLGVNEDNYDPEKDIIVDMGSCTTNCLAPVLKIIHEKYNIKSGVMTTIHSYTMGQNLLDGPHKDMRRARAAAVNLVPTTTGAAKAVGRVIPELDGVINGMAVRVPTPTVSVVDLVLVVDKETTKEDVNNTLEGSSKEERLKSILKVENRPLVSSDFVGSSYSSIVDADITDVKDNLIKIFSWYDNEWGYSCRLADFAKYISNNSHDSK